MGARPGHAAGSRRPAGLIGAVGLVIACEAALGLRVPASHDLGSFQYEVAGRAAGREAPGCDVLCFGDSLVMTAVLPRVIEGGSGLRCYNMAAFGGQAPASYELLRRAIDAGARPSAIIVDFFPSMLASGPRYNARNWPHVLGLRGCVELGWRAGDPGLLGEMVAGRLIPSVRRRGALRDWFVRVVTRRPDPWRYERRWLAHHLGRGRGALVMHHESQRGIDPAYWQTHAFPADWACDPVNEGYVGRFLALAAGNGATVYWLLPPFVATVQAECERSGFDARYLAFVRSWQARFPNVVVVDGRHAGYDPDVYTMDPAHLGRDGAYVLSAELAEVLRRSRAGPAPRRVELPRYRPRPVDPDVEDDLQARRTAWGPKPPRRDRPAGDAPLIAGPVPRVMRETPRATR